jgi:hypothetical protein
MQHSLDYLCQKYLCEVLAGRRSFHANPPARPHTSYWVSIQAPRWPSKAPRSHYSANSTLPLGEALRPICSLTTYSYPQAIHICYPQLCGQPATYTQPVYTTTLYIETGFVVSKQHFICHTSGHGFTDRSDSLGQVPRVCTYTQTQSGTYTMQTRQTDLSASLVLSPAI